MRYQKFRLNTTNDLPLQQVPQSSFGFCALINSIPTAPKPSWVECAPTPIVMLVVRVLRKVVTVLFDIDYVTAPASPHGLERGKSQGSQATVEQPLIDINIVGYQLPEASAKLRQIASGVKSFKQTDAVQNLEAFGLGQFVQRNECLALPTTKK